MNNIILNWEDDAPLIIHYLGTDMAEAENVRHLLATNPVKGVARVERLLTEISVKPKKTKTTTPDPDEELPGSTSSGGKRGPKGAKFE